jgi:hypothetical protein
MFEPMDSGAAEGDGASPAAAGVPGLVGLERVPPAQLAGAGTMHPMTHGRWQPGEPAPELDTPPF